MPKAGISIAKRKHVCEIGPPKTWNPQDARNLRNPTNTRNLPAYISKFSAVMRNPLPKSGNHLQTSRPIGKN